MASSGGPIRQILKPKQRCSQKNGDGKAANKVTQTISISVATTEAILTESSISEEVKLTESSIRENMVKHKKAIIASMNIQRLNKLFRRYEIDDILEEPIGRRKKAQKLFEQVLDEEDSLSFYDCLTNDKEHKGHKYIACLLDGTQFAKEEDIQNSAEIKGEIDNNNNINVEELNVHNLCPYLLSAELLTTEEGHNLKSSNTSPEEKAWMLLRLLDTKGPTAYYIFAYRCLALESEHLAHADLFTKLTGETVENHRRKRKAPDDETCTTLSKRLRESPEGLKDDKYLAEIRSIRRYHLKGKECWDHANGIIECDGICTTLSKRYPCLLESPEGLKNDKYLAEIRSIRRYHLKGKEWWNHAEGIKISIMDSEDYTREMKIAVLLESCTMFITDENEREVLARVETADKMCNTLHKEGFNVDMLEARCLWTKAKLYRYTKNFDKAEELIAIARSKLHNCEEGEERALVSYCYACILLAKTPKNEKHETQAFQDLHLAIRCAREGESPNLKQGKYGLDPTHCKLRLAQAYVGSSTGNTGKKLGDVSQKNITEAMTVLKTIEEKDLENRQKCMYLFTMSDVLRANNQLNEALNHADRALRLAEKHKFKTEIKSAKLRKTSAFEDQHHFAIAY